MLRVALLGRFLLLAPLALCAGVAHAWPDRPITLIVPFSAGGPTDTIGRILAESMSRALGKTIVVENVTGAGGTIANARVIKSPPDGYTIMIGHVGTHVFAPAVQRLNVDYLRDFDPVALVATNPEVIVSRNDVPANSLQELIAWVRASPPGTVSFASGGAGTPSHIMAVQFGQLVAPLNIVHYRGAAPAMLDVVAGHVDLSFDQAATGLTYARSGKVRAYAITAKNRLASAADIPTVDEAGLSGFYMSIWHGIWAPHGTSPDVITKIDEAVREALADPLVRKRLVDLGQDIPPPDQQTPEALRALQKAEVEKWHPLIKAANIKAD